MVKKVNGKIVIRTPIQCECDPWTHFDSTQDRHLKPIVDKSCDLLKARSGCGYGKNLLLTHEAINRNEIVFQN